MGRQTYCEQIKLGACNQNELDRLLAFAAKIPAAGKRIAFLSARFLGVTYLESTLIGDPNTPEIFVINLGALDCFTYLDYVEAMRRSDSFASFKENVRTVRYQSGKVDYTSRKHFFTDWIEASSRLRDVTAAIGGTNAKVVHKRLNDRGSERQFVPGVEPLQRVITFIPGKAIDGDVIRRLRSGDYIGIYSREKGLDVSHVGIMIKKNRASYFRHASSLQSQRKVIDQDFTAYAARKPGIVVLRPVA